MRNDTRLIHEGMDPKQHHDSLTVPLYQTSTYTFHSAEQGQRRFAGEESGGIYSRLGNPTVEVLEKRMMALENGGGALAFGSGMAAVSTILVHLTKAGDHILCSKGLYGCTFGLLGIFETKYNITHTLSELASRQEIEEALTDKTTVIYVESPINPTMEIVDLALVCEVAKERGIRVVVDNTFCSPYLQQPLVIGADFVLHSATKYLNGHGDVIAGILVGRDADEMHQIRMTVQKDYGGIISPFDAWLILRGLKTLHVRMDRHVTNAEKLLSYLKTEPAISKIFYPFDEDHPQMAIAKKQMKAGGGLISFVIEGGTEAAQRFLNNLRLIHVAVSLGDAETLIQHPATMTHSVVPEEDRLAMGIDNGMLRLSVGLEDAEDIIDDLKKAFQAI
ncbi:methionine gamma-lyase [Chryseomicrobium sp. FSL W7-1435]|uniref:methionine gamma-lyase n=1 Tax=Chryseomicrobium sp. FSL W7-1435 TaxID=2921704 RepID=UPI00315A2ABA